MARLTFIHQVGLAASCMLAALTAPAELAAATGRCEGYGALQSFGSATWESGLGAWSVSRHDIANSATFDTPNWSVVSSLPDARPGSAAFVPNLDNGDCSVDDETGGLRLDSPPIAIPAGTAIPRISVIHWFQVEDGWDGGDFRISVNGGGFNRIPPAAIETHPYNRTLEPALDEFGIEYNTNPFAGLVMFSGTIDGQPTGRWVESRIDLTGLAGAGNTIRLRVDFGVDCANGEVGWFVDDVDFYHCEFELPPSICGNKVLNGPEQCDDGNPFVGDGCSHLCQVETGWSCAAPTVGADTLADPGFEAGTPNASWTEVSNNPNGTPICSAAVCGVGGGSGPASGTYWAWFGGVLTPHEGSLSQTATIPANVGFLEFSLEIPVCDSPQDYLEVLIDGNPVYVVDGSSPLCGLDGYTIQSADIQAYADGGSHTIEFHSETFSAEGGRSNFFVDQVKLAGRPSICHPNGTSLILKKSVVDDDGGFTTPSAWTLEAVGPSSFSGSGPVVVSGSGFLPGTYDLSENGPDGYAAGDWSCDGGSQIDGDTVTIDPDEAVTCSLTNDDVAPTLTVDVQALNDDGGPVTDGDAFGPMIDGQEVPDGIPVTVDFGDHTVSQAGLPGYVAGTWGGDCAADGSITMSLGQNATCTISNDDIAPTLTLVKSIINDDAGTVFDPDVFDLRIDDVGVGHGVANAVAAGPHTVSEAGLPGYVAGPWGGDCAANGSITLELAQDATCTITNDDVDRTRLTLVKQVINNNGGTAPASAWTLMAAGPAGFSGQGPTVNSGAGLAPGTYHLSESGGPPGYSSSAWACVGGTQLDGDTVMLALDETASCTIVNDDLPATLKLFKTVTNNNGGTVNDPNAFGLKIDGVGVSHDTAYVVDAGSHFVSEDGLAGYQQGAWGGACAANGSVTLALGQNATCTITNDDIAPTLRVVKNIVNDDGGTVTNPNAFGLKIDNVAVSHNVPKAVSPGPHTVSETGLTGYLAGSWVGDCNPDGTISLALGQNATCTITNDDIAPTLTVVKFIENDNGGTENDPDAFGLRIDGAPVVSGFANILDAGNHTVSEDGLPGYVAGTWGGDCNPNGTISLAPGENATCTITNDDSANTRLTLIKNVQNNNGGHASSGDWTLTATGPQVVSGSGPFVQSAPGLLPGAYDLSESGPAGYAASAWACTGAQQVDADTVAIALGQAATCSITNDDIGPKLVLVNTVTNDNGGTAGPNAFGLRIDGFPALNNTPTATLPGNRTASADGLPGYLATSWGGDCAPDGSVTLALGETKTCSIGHNDITPTLTVTKQIVNNNGGTVNDPDAFGLRIDGNPVLHGQSYPVDAGAHLVSEIGQPGYVPGLWGGNCGPGGNITLALAQNATCTITNDDSNVTSLTLVKQVVNDSGGTAEGADWTLTASGPGLLTGSGPIVTSGPGFSAGTYTLSESGGPAGYAAGAWSCVGGSQAGNSITLALGQAATCTIVNNDMQPTLTVVKNIVNDQGGTVNDPDDFGLMIDDNPVADSIVYPVDAGAHTVSEAGLPGYQAGPWGGDCASDGSITLALGQDAVCTVTNNDVGPTLTVVKTIVNDDGGNVFDPNAFSLTIDEAPVLHNTPYPVAVGSHQVAEVGLPGYAAGPWGGDCNPDGTVALALGEDAVCTITNNDIAPTLTVTKTISNNNGGAVEDPNAFGLRIDNVGVLHGVPYPVSAGFHSVSEVGLPGYVPGPWSGDCAPDGGITLNPGQNATCSIENDDTNETSLTLVKQVINDDGGTSPASAWTLTASSGATPVLSGPGPNVSSGPGFSAGTYDLSESGPPGYGTSGWACVGGNQAGNSITLELDDVVTCTVSSNDIAPTLKVVKQIVNDNGGTVENANSFGLRIDGATVQNNAVNLLDAGPHTVSEDGRAGYLPGPWGGDCAADGSIVLALDQDATCTISNDDIAPSLTLVKQVVNDNGGTALAPAWMLHATGTEAVLNGPGPSVSSGANFKAGVYTLSESGGTTGYNAGSWVCVGGSQAGNSVTLAPGESATCTVTNNDIGPTLKVVNTVTNDNGGTVNNPNSFGLRIDGAPVSHNVVKPVNAGDHTVSQVGLGGYTAGTWGGDCAANGSITLALGQNATCTVTNDDIAPVLTLAKAVVNDDDGTASPSAWTLNAAGPTPLSGSGSGVTSPATFKAGAYTLSESGGPAGYAASAWVCTGGSQGGPNTITLALAQTASCTITNDDVAPSLRVFNTVLNNHGGTLSDPEAFGLKIDGAAAPHDNPVELPAGNHTASATGLAGYQASAWGGDCAADGSITLALGQAATCTISHDDIGPRLRVVKTVVNLDGGTTDDPDAFGLRVNGNPVLNDAVTTLAAGSHTVSEDGLPGYQAGPWGGDCAANGSIVLALDQDATCTVSNDDIGPTLKVVNTVTNDNGGTVNNPDSFGLRIDGAPVSDNVAKLVNAGDHTVSQVGLGGYAAGTWGGDCAANGSITLALGQNATCTVTNDDIAPVLTLAKAVVNDDDGTASPSAWTLNAAGPTPLSGPGSGVTSGATFKAGAYTLSESGGPAGYEAEASGWVCTGGSQGGPNAITLALAQTASCTITNDDVAPALKVVNTIVNDNGGTISNPNSFGLRIDGAPVSNNVGISVGAGSHTVSQDGRNDYAAGSWGGDCAADGTVTLASGQVATCTITNNDIAPLLTLMKDVINDDGGNATAADWMLHATGTEAVLNGPGPSVTSPATFKAGVYTLSESGGPAGYAAAAWNCVGGSQGGGNTVTLALAEIATCTIANDDIAPTLKLVKTIVNDDGGTEDDPNSFGLRVDGALVADSVINAFAAGSHTASEDGRPGYQAGDWGGDCDADGSITLALDQDAVCTLTNDDVAPSLTLVKQVVNNNGGLAQPQHWTLHATGPVTFSGPGPSVSNGESFPAGTYDLSESGGPAGYHASIWNCSGGLQVDADSVTLEAGDAAVCTIINDDAGPGLTLVKVVVNDNGGVAAPSDWHLAAQGPTPFSGPGPFVSSPEEFEIGSYDLSESGGPSGYDTGDWQCEGGAMEDGDTVTVGLGEPVTCTLTNNDSRPTLTLVKQVVNDNGGAAVPSNWTLHAAGPSALAGPGPTVSSGAGFKAGSYALSEAGGPEGYEASDWECNGGTQPDGETIVLALGETATCTITNDDPGVAAVIFHDGFETND